MSPFVRRARVAALYLIALTSAYSVCSAAQAGAGVAINMDLTQASKLAAAAKTNGIELVSGNLQKLDSSTRLVVIEAGGPDLSPDELSRLGSWVQNGGSLLVTLAQSPGGIPMQLAFLSPTTGWETQIGSAARGGAFEATTAAQADTELFPQGVPPGLTLPFHFEIRPWHAVERGEARYERFARTIPYINLPQQPGDTFWTRPLLNRDWKIRLRGDDARQTPLLLTGRYGAGRVAVFASSAQGVNDSAGADVLWNSTIKWLSETTPAAVAPQLTLKPEVAVDPATRAVTVTIQNPTAAPLSLQVVMRLLTWEHALADDLSQNLTVPPSGKASAVFTVPAPGVTNFQALDFRDAYEARIGVLSGDGATLLNETHLPVDFQPGVVLSLSTDDVRTVPYPFDAPAYDGQPASFPFRMGFPVMAYAYPPGQKANISVSIANGVRNIAPMAQVVDETTPTSFVGALTDGAARGNANPGMDAVMGDGLWRGTRGQENVLSFNFPHPCKISGIALNGEPDAKLKSYGNNPSAVTVELDGKQVLSQDLKDRFASDLGLVKLTFPPTSAQVVRLHFPSGGTPQLAEVEIEGTTGDLPPSAHGTLKLTLIDALSGKATPLNAQDIDVPAGEEKTVQIPVDLPKGGGEAQFYRVEATFAGQKSSAPILQIQPEHPLKPATPLFPNDASRLGFSIASGFRSAIDLDTGAKDAGGGGGRPPVDTLLWAYEHNMKQLGSGANTEVGRLYSSEGNTTYVTTPWRAFSNGESFYDVVTPILVEKMKEEPTWKTSNIALLNHGDRWDSGPAVDTLNGWQDFIGFDDYLQSKGKPGLQGKTRREIVKDIHGQHEADWQEWNLERYVSTIKTISAAFAKEGKTVHIQGQGMPIVPPGYDTSPLTDVVQGVAQDSTWEMGDENVAVTTGFNMATKAYNPGWKLSTQFVWGFVSAVLSNPKWHVAVSTTEPSRRNIYDKAFRGTISDDGVYESIHTYGYNMNAGVAYTMSKNDWQESWRAQERNSLLTPDGPIGIGLIVPVGQLNNSENVMFSGGGMGDDWGHNVARQHVLRFSNVLRRLQEAGLPISFGANVTDVSKWGKVAPLIILDPDTLSDAEVESLRALHQKGAPIAALQGTGPLSTAAAQFFGVTPDGQAATAHAVGDLDGHPILAGDGTLFVPVTSAGLDSESAIKMAPLLQSALQPPLRLPEGTEGYGFTSNHRAFVLVEDYREEGRVATVRYRADAKATAVYAVDVNDHRSLPVRRDGPDWCIDVALRPGDGALIAIEETPASSAGK
jgi:hypothetical protein